MSDQHRDHDRWQAILAHGPTPAVEAADAEAPAVDPIAALRQQLATLASIPEVLTGALDEIDAHVRNLPSATASWEPVLSRLDGIADRLAQSDGSGPEVEPPDATITVRLDTLTSAVTSMTLRIGETRELMERVLTVLEAMVENARPPIDVNARLDTVSEQLARLERRLEPILEPDRPAWGSQPL